MRQNEYIQAVIHSAGIRVPFYWVDPKVHSGFSITAYRKTQKKFLANPKVSHKRFHFP